MAHEFLTFSLRGGSEAHATCCAGYFIEQPQSGMNFSKKSLITHDTEHKMDDMVHMTEDIRHRTQDR